MKKRLLSIAALLAVMAVACTPVSLESVSNASSQEGTTTEEEGGNTGDNTGGSTGDNTGGNTGGNTGDDSGAGTYTYASTGDTSSDDDISLTTFQRMITVIYSGTSATVTGDYYGFATTDGAHVKIVNTNTSENVVYKLTGSATDGSFTLYSSKKQAIYLEGVSLTNPSGAAINNQSGKRTFVIVEGVNTLSDASGAAYTASGSEDLKAVFFSEGQLIFSGSGSLTVNALNSQGKAGITSDDYVRFMAAPTVKVTAGSGAGNCVRGKDFIRVSDGTVDLSASAAMRKGFSTDSLARFDGGTTTIKITGGTAQDTDGSYSASAGVKADQLVEFNGGSLTITNSGQGGKGISCDGKGTFTGGTLNITVTGSNYGSSSSGGGPGGGRPGQGGSSGGSSSDNSKSAKGMKFDGDIVISGGAITVAATSHEAIETKGTLTFNGGTTYAKSGDDAINSASTMTINDGNVCAYSTGNDGIDANGNLYIKGGVVYAIGKTSPEMAIDANTEGGAKLYVQGGTIVAIGSLESGASLTQACYYASSWTKNAWYSITVGSNTFAFKTPSSGGTSLIVSGASKPSVKSNVTVTGGSAVLGGMVNFTGTVSGGNNVTLSTYSGGGGRW